MARTRVKLSELALAVEHVSFDGFGDAEAYLALDSGTIHMVGDTADDIDEAAGDALPADFDELDRYLGIPTKRDLGLGKRLAVAFARMYLDEDDANEVEAYFQRKGAYASFKGLLERRGRLQEWYDHEAKALRQELVAWCEANDLELIDDGPPR